MTTMTTMTTMIDIRHCAMAVVVLGLAAGHARAAQPTRVGVVVAVAVDDGSGEADELAAALGRALRQRLAVDTVAGAEVTRRLPDGVPPDCVARSACVRDVGQRLDADELLFLVVVRVGRRVQIDPTWVDVGSGTTNARAALHLEDGGRDPQVVFADAAPALLPHGNVIAARRDHGRHLDTRTWIAGGVAAAALAGGLGFALAARDTRDGLDADDCQRHACDPERIDRLDRQTLTADLLLGTAAVAGATAVYFYLTSDDESAPVGVSPTPGGAAVTFAGRF
jgi:hypothetical protein